MNCPKCGNPVAARRKLCDICGCDLSVYRRIIHLSNRYFNLGLEKAKVRDLTGAAALLKKSLETNKMNTDSRNLLGLVYFEMGEAVAALSEWVISKHFQPEENAADYYIEMVQSNPTKLDYMNQAIKKYNIALEAAKQENDDLAIIQLKKVVSLHPNFIRAMQLLALLYIKSGEYERATKQLKRILCIDVANTTSLRYMSEISKMTAGEHGGDIKARYQGSEAAQMSEGRGIAPATTYREDKPNVMVFVNLLLGVLIGIAVVYYLIVPTIEQNIKEEYNSQKVDYSSELSAKTATITQQEKTIAALEKKLADAEEVIADFEVPVVEESGEVEDYSELFEAWNMYLELKSKVYSDEELETLALTLWAIDTTGYVNEESVQVLDAMRNEIYPLAARKIYKAGKSMYDDEQYEEAVSMLSAAVDFNKESDTAMYYLGKAYQALGKLEEAARYYNLMLEVCPNSTLKQYIPQRLRECGYTGEQGAEGESSDGQSTVGQGTEE